MSDPSGSAAASLFTEVKRTRSSDDVVDQIRASGGDAIAVPTDVSKREELEALAQTAVARFGRIDTWINDAGVSIYGRLDEVAEVDWAVHIPNLIDYWCWIVLGTDRYRGAVTATHRRLHERSAVSAEHCVRWFALWTATIDASWAGPHADKAKDHARALMAGMATHVFGCSWTSAGQP